MKTSKEIYKHLEALTNAAGFFESLKDTLQEKLDAKQEKFENMGEKAQEGERGEKLSAEIDQLETECDTIETHVTAINEAKDELEGLLDTE